MAELPVRPTRATHPSSRQTGAGIALIRCLPADEVADPYSARLPSRPLGEKSRRAPVGRGVADGRGAVSPAHLSAVITALRALD